MRPPRLRRQHGDETGVSSVESSWNDGKRRGSSVMCRGCGVRRELITREGHYGCLLPLSQITTQWLKTIQITFYSSGDQKSELGLTELVSRPWQSRVALRRPRGHSAFLAVSGLEGSLAFLGSRPLLHLQSQKLNPSDFRFCHHISFWLFCLLLPSSEDQCRIAG